jgi:phosphoribosylformimino-5-aminoimidazole carboxamide ribotide isomerase
MEQVTVFSDNPVEMAGQWMEAGARRLHIVDLDGAVAGKPVNAAVIQQIANQYPELPIQVGGGIRDAETVQAYLEAGVQYTIIGTKAVSTPHFVNDLCLEFPSHIIVGLDAKDGKVAIEGWSKLSNHDVIDMAKRFENDGVAAIIFTDISRDGMMRGVNVDSTMRLAQQINIPVIASGGVSTLDDIRALLDVEEEGVEGVIIGRALYEGSIDFSDAQTMIARNRA